MSTANQTFGLVRGLALLLLAAQVVGIGVGRFVPERFFCWAPFDVCHVFTTRVWVGGRELDRAAIDARYRYPTAGMEPRSIHNLFAIIRRYETTLGRADQARVEVTHWKNGGPEELWLWPPPP